MATEPGTSSADAIQHLGHHVVSYQNRNEDGDLCGAQPDCTGQIVRLRWSKAGSSPLLAALIARLCGLANPNPITDKAHHLGQPILPELAEVAISPLALPDPDHPGLRQICEALVAIVGMPAPMRCAMMLRFSGGQPFWQPQPGS